jgi:hypothetical protein
VLINDTMMGGSQNGHPIKPICNTWQVLTHLDTADSGINSLIGGTGDTFPGITKALRIKGIDLRHAATKPQKDTSFGLAKRYFWRSRFRQQGRRD